MRPPGQSARVGFAVALVAAVYGYVRLMNPDWPVLADESWRPAIELLSWPGLWIVTILVVLGLLNIHGEAIEFVQWGSSFFVYSLLVWGVGELLAALLARLRRER